MIQMKNLIISTVALGTSVYLHRFYTKQQCDCCKQKFLPKKTQKWDVWGNYLKFLEINESSLVKNATKERKIASSDRKDTSWVANCATIKENPTFPTISSLKGGVFQISCNYHTKVPDWSVQHVKSNHANEQISQEVNDALAHSSLLIDPCTFANLMPQDRNNHLWTDLHDYAIFLLQKHCNVYICSGPIYKIVDIKSDSSQGNEVPQLVTLTHFYRVIIGENADGTFRFECYKIPFNAVSDRSNLCNFQVKRGELEESTRYLIFQDVKPQYVTETCQNPEFRPRLKYSH